MSFPNDECCEQNFNDFRSDYVFDTIPKSFGSLGEESEDSWRVSDSDDHLKIVHYTSNSDKRKYGNLRGAIYTREGKLFIGPGEFTPVIIADELKIQKQKSEETLIEDINGEKHLIGNISSISRGEEGAILRVFKYEGKIYCSTYHYLDCVQSHWASERSFCEHFINIIPHPEQLFDSQFTSDVYYIFMISTPSTSFSSKTNSTNKIIYMGTFNTYDNKNTRVDKIDNVEDPVKLTVEQANLHLKYGYTHNCLKSLSEEKKKNLEDTLDSDYRANFGEFVAIHDQNGRVFKICSRAYHWRFNMMNNCQRLETRLLDLINDRSPRVNTKTFFKRYVHFEVNDEIQDLKQFDLNSKKIIIFETEDNKNINDSERLLIICKNLIHASSLSKQDEAIRATINVLKRFTAFYMAIREVILYLFSDTENRHQLVEKINSGKFIIRLEDIYKMKLDTEKTNSLIRDFKRILCVIFSNITEENFRSEMTNYYGGGGTIALKVDVVVRNERGNSLKRITDAIWSNK